MKHYVFAFLDSVFECFAEGFEVSVHPRKRFDSGEEFVAQRIAARLARRWLGVELWTENGKSMALVANSGEYRVPFSGDLDIGAADFGVNPKYVDYGWREVQLPQPPELSHGRAGHRGDGDPSLVDGRGGDRHVAV